MDLKPVDLDELTYSEYLEKRGVQGMALGPLALLLLLQILTRDWEINIYIKTQLTLQIKTQNGNTYKR